MLEIRYNKDTGELTGWWGDRHGNHEIKLRDRPNEAIVLLDIPIPEKPLEALLFDQDSETLIDNPAYIEPYDPTLDRTRFQEIIATSPEVITMPEMWEAIRILGRLIS